MTTRFRVYGKPENQADDCDDVIETLGAEVAEMVHEFADFAEDVKATAIDIRGELKHLRDGLNMLEAAGNHNTKIASEEFKKIEHSFQVGSDRISKLEAKSWNQITTSAAEARISKLEQTALTRDEVADFVASTRKRIVDLESVQMSKLERKVISSSLLDLEMTAVTHDEVADAYTAIKDLKQRLSNIELDGIVWLDEKRKELEQRLDNQIIIINNLQKQISELVAQVSRRRIGGYGTTGF